MDNKKKRSASGPTVADVLGTLNANQAKAVGLIISEYEKSTTFEIHNKVDESQTEFVFTVLTKFANSEEKFREVSISKELIIKALDTFKTEHPDEFAKLSGTSVDFVK